MKKLFVILFLLAFPAAYAQWEEWNNGLYGGRVECVLPLEGVLLAGTPGGVFRSIDNGDHWNLTSLSGIRVTALAASANKLFAGSERGMYFSTDNGATWTASSTLPIQISSFAVGDGIIFAGGWGWGIYRSTDDGKNWTEINSVILSSYVKSIFILNGAVYAGTNDGIFRTTNNGNEWTKLNIGNISFSSINDFVKSGDAIIAATSQGVLVSMDGGNSWSLKTEGINKAVNSIAAIDSNLYAATEQGIYYSHDVGASWVAKGVGVTSQFLNAIEIRNETLYVGAREQGFFVSSDLGNTWQKKNNGLAALTVNALLIKGNTMIAGTEELGVFRSDDLGANWEQAGFTSAGARNGVVFGNKFVIGTADQGVFVSTDDGANWQQKNDGLTNLQIRSIAASNSEVYVGANALYRSTTGESWTKSNLNYSIISILPRENDIFAGATGVFGVYYSSDNGATWQSRNTGLENQAIYTFEKIGSNVYGSTSNGIYYTTDNGNNWSLFSQGLGAVKMNVLKAYGTKLLGGDRGAFWIFPEGGVGWVGKPGNLADRNIISMEIAGDYVYIGTSGNGVLRARLDVVTSARDAAPVPGLTLYPNPAADRLVVKSADGSLFEGRIRIFDMMGAELLSAKPDGEESQTLNVGALPPGAYFVRIGGASAIFIKE